LLSLRKIFFREYELDLEETLKSGKAAELNIETAKKLVECLKNKGYFCVVLYEGERKMLRKVMVGWYGGMNGDNDFYKIVESFGLKYNPVEPSSL